jgi:glycosyltransferase involved in cell wall biosynthesis
MRVIHIIAGLAQDGAQSVLHRLVSQNHSRDQHIVISMMDEGIYGPRMKEAGVRLYVLDMPHGRMTLSGVVKLYRLLRILKPDVVQTWMYHADLVGGILARLARSRIVVWGVRHSDHDSRRTKRSTRLVARLCALISGLVPSLIVSCSQRAVAIHRELGYPGERFRVIPNGYDLSQLVPDPAQGMAIRQELRVPQDALLAGFVARWHPQKDHANLVRALAILKGELPELRCLFVGEGMDYDNAELAQLLSNFGITDQVILAGRRTNISGVMNAMDVHVLPSAFGEAFPNVVAEAMACGTPCVVTDVGDAGLIVGSTAALQERRNAPVAWEKRKAACRERIAQHFSLERMGAAYSAVWQEALRRNRGARAREEAP